jgi:hypothetical protein
MAMYARAVGCVCFGEYARSEARRSGGRRLQRMWACSARARRGEWSAVVVVRWESREGPRMEGLAVVVVDVG